jgi:cell division protein FtsW
MAAAISTAALVSLGLVAIVSSEIGIGWGTEAGRQVIWCGVGLLVAMVAALADYRWLRYMAWPLFVLAVGSLVAVLVVGEERNGAQRWLALGNVLSFQPSEVAKLALIVLLAYYGEYQQRYMHTWWRGMCMPGCLVVLVLVLVFKEPDWGTTMLIAAVSGCMLLVAGVRWRHVLPLAAAGVVLLSVLLVQNPMRWNRVVSWWSPQNASEAVTWQTDKAKAAMANGGVFGTGLGEGEAYGTVPEVRTDFIFALIGEELGLVGTSSVVLAFLVFLVSGMAIAWKARDTFGLLLSSGLTLLIALQATINIGVVTAVFPNKGLALPFLSRGGTNLVVALASVGILFSVARITAREQLSEEPIADLEELGASLTT